MYRQIIPIATLALFFSIAVHATPHSKKVPVNQYTIKSLGVFCGVGGGNLPVYLQSAQEMGKAIARRGIKLVYGGADLGAMGLVSRSVLDNGGEVLGIIPHAIHAITGDSIGTTMVANNVYHRKKLFLDECTSLFY
jgi:hypothetical protein